MELSEASRRFLAGRRLGLSAASGAALVLPLAAMEWKAGGGFPTGVPIALFTALWLIAAAFFLVSFRAVHRHGREAREERVPLPVWAALTLALLLAWLWVSLVRDQWPCFRGLPNCD